MKMQMLMVGVLLLAGAAFAEIPPNYDPFMYSKLGSSFCQGMVLNNYLEEIYDEGCAGQETQGNILQWGDDMWDEGEAMFNLYFTYVFGQECCDRTCDQACLRQVRGQFMSYQRPVSSLMSSGRGLFLRAGRECIQNEGMQRSYFLSMYRAYSAETLDCMRRGFDALPPED